MQTYSKSITMNNQHNNPTISFRITVAEQKQIEARILASGLMKKDYFVRFLHLQSYLRCWQERNHLSSGANCECILSTIT